MSKVSNMLKLIQILKDGNVHSIVSLANTIEVSDRMIRQYKLELEQAGIYIKSITGKYGGYKIEKSENLNWGRFSFPHSWNLGHISFDNMSLFP